MESQQVLQLKGYLNTISRRKWLILSGVLLGLTCGLFFYLKQDKVYEGKALLIYQPQEQNSSQMPSDEQAEIQNVVNSLTQIIVSQSSLEKIIIQEDLYTIQRDSLAMEDAVELMRRNINIELSSYKNTFAITYEGSDPDRVIRVTNLLAARFVEEYSPYRIKRASERSAFIENELGKAREKLDQKEAEMSDYKLKYYNEMPGRLSTNMSRLKVLQDQYKAKLESIQGLKRMRGLTLDQINLIKNIVDENQRPSELLLTGAESQRTSIYADQRAKLEILRSGLRELQDKYTDQPPMVKKLEIDIADVEKLIEKEEQKKVVSGSDATRQKNFNDDLLALQTRLNDINMNIDKLERKNEETKAIIETYEGWIAYVPTREAEWSSLTREYAELERQYDSLAAQNILASSALNLEKKQKQRQLRIEDPARISETPVKPNLRKIMLVTIIAGLFVGGSFAFAADMFDTTFRNQAELEQTLNLPVICSVPTLPLAGEATKKRFWSLLKVGFFTIWFFVICIALILVAKEGKIVTQYLQFPK
ncbi:GumC family protein [Thermodesulfobacteriota bacterium]